jgi:putative two-component system response regulator
MYKDVDMAEEKIILAVDDMPEVLTSITEILGDDYDVRPVKSAAAAMLLLKTETIDLILLDIDMPVLSGLDFQEFIKRKPESCGIPVLFITSITNPDVVRKAESSGAVGVILKPFTASELKTTIKGVLV